MSDSANPEPSSQPVAEPQSHDLAVMGAAADVMAAEVSSAQETRTVAVRELELQMAHQAHGPMGNGNVFGVTPAERLTHAHGMKEFQKAHNQFNVAKTQITIGDRPPLYSMTDFGPPPAYVPREPPSYTPPGEPPRYKRPFEIGGHRDSGSTGGGSTAGGGSSVQRGYGSSVPPAPATWRAKPLPRSGGKK